jgi:hypothetical protein
MRAFGREKFFFSRLLVAIFNKRGTPWLQRETVRIGGRRTHKLMRSRKKGQKTDLSSLLAVRIERSAFFLICQSPEERRSCDGTWMPRTSGERYLALDFCRQARYF